jgi:soluble lytic murein transglycosylase-like protein
VTNAPILQSPALQRALAASSVRRAAPIPTSTNFATTLARAEARPAASVSRAQPQPQGELNVPFGDLISAAAKKHGIDPALLAGLVKTESNFNPNAQSGAGAKGLTQLMDATARGLGVTN